ncbi:unnamed protein product [Didymodactylos carnosus]|uniref:Uncharacterized protein n=1 Tax=Didymodactylos carnosus TaxID=1234261 RepID=A0A814ISC5_9BILA|nr:unnamed protein product [Didymodactylos carnosus]CAF1051457.1 unnamed protein product [Didymodactylos carnosus]CAF3800789.1 unnamed protein product [Didymodactylos carnosus]CAF3818198.1 unnamed protein product [Didymodactylos carnosus]
MAYCIGLTISIPHQQLKTFSCRVHWPFDENSNPPDMSNLYDNDVLTQKPINNTILPDDCSSMKKNDNNIDHSTKYNSKIHNLSLSQNSIVKEELHLITNNKNFFSLMTSLGLKLKLTKMTSASEQPINDGMPSTLLTCYNQRLRKRTLLNKKYAAPLCLLNLKTHHVLVKEAIDSVLPQLRSIPIVKDYEKYCCSKQYHRQLSSQQSMVHYYYHRSQLTFSHSRGLVRRDEQLSTKTLKRDFSIETIIKDCKIVLSRLESCDLELMIQSSSTTKKKRKIQKAKRTPINGTKMKKRKRPNEAGLELKNKRMKKIVVDQPSLLEDQNNDSSDDCVMIQTSTSSFNRICLKCFLCDERIMIIYGHSTSNSLHSHYLLHKNSQITLNIYDTEIDQQITRMVEFFIPPKRHALEGKVKEVFILNGQELRRQNSENISLPSENSNKKTKKFLSSSCSHSNEIIVLD